MKTMFLTSMVVAGVLAASTSFAGQACSAVYASGLGHVLDGTSRPLGNNEKMLPGQSSKDSLYTVTVSKKGVPSLKETKSGKAVVLKDGEMGDLKIYATETLKLYPSGVPGSFDERQFIVVICADESAF